jgi:hypothetical protein
LDIVVQSRAFSVLIESEPEALAFLFDGFSSREPVSTPHQSASRLSLENAINQNSVGNSAPSLGDALG